VASENFSFANFLHFGFHIPIVIIGELLFRNPSKVGKDCNDKVVDLYVNYVRLKNTEIVQIRAFMDQSEDYQTTLYTTM
jgi:hypothetical protein